MIKATTDQEFAEIVLVRKNGSDGTVTVEYETFELDSTTLTAQPWKDYEPQESTISFKSGETR